MRRAISLTIVCALAGPLVWLGTPYLAGRHQADSLYALFPMLGGGVLSAILLCLLLGTASRGHLPRTVTAALLLAVFCLHYLALSLILPNYNAIWCRGFIDSLDNHVGLEEFQAWGESAVTRFDRNELKIDGKCDFYAGHAPKIAAREVPETIASAWNQKPEIGVHKVGYWLNDSYVSFTWYGGLELLVGRPNLAFTGEPGTLVYARTIRPGVILTCWDVK